MAIEPDSRLTEEFARLEQARTTKQQIATELFNLNTEITERNL